MDELHEHLKGKISALAGPSGVGKSSLLNAIQPGLGLAVREISEAFQKGRHTTTVRQLFPLEAGRLRGRHARHAFPGAVGYRAGGTGWLLPRTGPLVAHCQFSNCNHKTEPGCAVRAAVEAGTVRPERYDSYLRLRAGEE